MYDSLHTINCMALNSYNDGVCLDCPNDNYNAMLIAMSLLIKASCIKASEGTETKDKDCCAVSIFFLCRYPPLQLLRHQSVNTE